MANSTVSEQVIKDMEELKAIDVKVPAKAFELAKNEERVAAMRASGMKIHEITDTLIMEAL